MIKAYKFRIYPDKEQIAILVNALNACRELYNAMLQQRIYAYGMGRNVTRYSQVNEIPEVKKAFPEFNNIHSQVIQEVPVRLDKAYDNFYRRVDKKKNGRNIKAGFPRFKSRKRYNSITYPQSGFKILENGHILASKIGEVRMFMHRPVDGKIRTLTFKRNGAGEWYAIITAGNPSKKKPVEDYLSILNEDMNPVGYDVGLKSLITDSNGDHTEAPQYFRKSEKILAKANRNLSRKKKYSKNWKKANRRLSRVYRKTVRQRDDYSNKLSRDIVDNGNLIVFEALNIQGMVRNHHLAKSIADASWYDIIRKTTYKAESAGKVVLLVDPGNTSKMCSKCGNIKKDLKLSDRIYKCDACGLVMDRDENAAINIKNRGLLLFLYAYVYLQKHFKKVGRGTPEFTPEEIGALPARATPVVETGSPRL